MKEETKKELKDIFDVKKIFLYSLEIRFMQQVWRRLCFRQV